MIAVAPSVAFSQPAAVVAAGQNVRNDSVETESGFFDSFILAEAGATQNSDEAQTTDENPTVVDISDDMADQVAASESLALAGAIWQPPIPISAALSPVTAELASFQKLEDPRLSVIPAGIDPTADATTLASAQDASDHLPNPDPSLGNVGSQPSDVVADEIRSLQENPSDVSDPMPGSKALVLNATHFPGQTASGQQHLSQAQNVQLSDAAFPRQGPATAADPEQVATSIETERAGTMPDLSGRLAGANHARMSGLPLPNVPFAAIHRLPNDIVAKPETNVNNPPVLSSVVVVAVPPQKTILMTSSAENAWRQKWVDETLMVPAADQNLSIGQTTPVDDGVQAPVTLPTAPTLALLTLAQSAQGFALDAPIPSDRQPISRKMAITGEPTLQNRAVVPLVVASASVTSDANPFRLDDGLELSSLLGAAVGMPTSVNGHMAGLSQGSPSPNLPAAIVPTLVDLARTGKTDPLELTLSPEELGRLSISLKQDGDFVHVTLHADRPETLDLMRRHAHELVADLRQAGFSGASLNFGQNGKEQHGPFANLSAETNPPSTANQSLTPETKPSVPNRSHKGTGVDLRF